jgi:hypothetical protein
VCHEECDRARGTVDSKQEALHEGDVGGGVESCGSGGAAGGVFAARGWIVGPRLVLWALEGSGRVYGTLWVWFLLGNVVEDAVDVLGARLEDAVGRGCHGCSWSFELRASSGLSWAAGS